jgi:hypothetical protein
MKIRFSLLTWRLRDVYYTNLAAQHEWTHLGPPLKGVARSAGGCSCILSVPSSKRAAASCEWTCPLGPPLKGVPPQPPGDVLSPTRETIQHPPKSPFKGGLGTAPSSTKSTRSITSTTNPAQEETATP